MAAGRAWSVVDMYAVHTWAHEVRHVVSQSAAALEPKRQSSVFGMGCIARDEAGRLPGIAVQIAESQSIFF